jgi:hypothetical protein
VEKMGRGKVIARPASRGDSDALATLLDECPMGSSIRLVMQRRPDYFVGASVQAQRPVIIVGEEVASGRLVGSFAAGARDVYVDGKARSVRYLSDLRIHPDHRHGTLLARGYRYLREKVFAVGEWAQTVVLDDNRPALDVLTSGRAGLPRYHPAGDYHCYMVSAGQRIRTTSTNLQIRAARASDIEAVQVFYDREAPRKAWCPVYCFRDLDSEYYRGLGIEDFVLAHRGSELVGMAACWDQSAYKQTRVASYERGLRWLRPAYNVAARIIPGRVPLPPAGTFLKSSYASAIHCLEDDPAILSTLLTHLLPAAHQSGADYLAVGLDAASPLCNALHHWRHYLVQGGHYLVGFGGGTPPLRKAGGEFYFECARI